MKNLVGIALSCMLGLLVSQSVSAQNSCGAAGSIQGGTATGNTCSGANLVAGVECGFVPYVGQQQVFSFTPAAGFTTTHIDLTNTSANGTWKPQMILQTGGTCGDSNDCNGGSVTAADSNQNTVTTLTFGNGGTTVPTAGNTYFLIVQAATSGQCGQYTLAAVPFPVKLQSFQVN